MSRTYDLFCGRHGHMRIEVEKPPIRFTIAPFCPFCLDRLTKPDKDWRKKWQPNFVGKGVAI